MSKKKGKRRQQQQRQQRRAAKTTQRHKDTGGRKHKATSPYAVEFDQLEAEAIAGMMVGGADEFAERFGGVLSSSDMLIEEEEFFDLDIDEETVAAAVAPLVSAAEAVDEESETADDEEIQEILGAILRHIMQDDGFRADLLSRLDQFVDRAHENSALRRKWLSAVAVKFLLEQPAEQLSARALNTCSLLMLLVEDAWERYEESQFFQASSDEATGDLPPHSQLFGKPLDGDAGLDVF